METRMPTVQELQTWLCEMEQLDVDFYVIPSVNHICSLVAQDEHRDCFIVFMDGNRVGEIYTTDWKIDSVSYKEVQ